MRTSLILFVLIVALLAIARKPRPVEDREGGYLETVQSSTSSNTTLSVATFNVQTGKSLDGVRDASKASAVMQSADIVGVQEVYAAGWLNRVGWGDKQSTQFAAAGKFSILYSPTRYRWFRENRGNLILTKLPINTWKTSMLHDSSGKSFRNLTVAQIKWGGQNIAFINTHLHTGSGRVRQLEEVLQEFSIHERAILVGDFNSKPDTQEIINVLNSKTSRFTVVDAVASAGLALDDENRIDWILTKGFKVTGGETQSKGISDHPYYQVELKLLP